MSPSRRSVVVLAVILAAGACGGPPPAPSGEPVGSGAPPPPATGASDPADALGAMIIRGDFDEGVRWWVTSPGDPLTRRPLAVPPGEVQLGPAAADGSVLLTLPDRVVVAQLVGDELRPLRSMDLADDGLGPSLPACISTGKAFAVADAETLAITVMSLEGPAVPLRAQLSLGECAWIDETRLVFSAEGDRLFAWDHESGEAVQLDAPGRRPSSAVALICVLDRSGPRPAIVVRETRPSAAALDILGRERFRIESEADETIANAQLSPDGGWLAVISDVGPEGAATRRLRFYQLLATGPERVGDVPLAAREQITLLPAGLVAP